MFGTDGIRGRAGEGWLSEEAVERVGRAVGQVLARDAGPHVALLGHDGRRSGPELERALARGLSASGVDAKTTGLISTPGLAWLTRAGDFRLGIMVSASHNPAHDNGIKVFSGEGDKLSDEAQEEIEALLRAAAPASENGAEVRPAHDAKLESDYLDHLLQTAGSDLSLAGIQLVLDCANGGGSRVAPRVFGRLGAIVHTLGAEPDGDNINQDCGSTHPERLQAEVVARGAQMGIALDGDGDRCILVDERGEIVHGDGIMTVIARHTAEAGGFRDPRIVATVMSNRGLHRALRDVGVKVVEVGVGDRQVVESLRKEGLQLGGEQSGHIVLGADNAYIGDGIVTALRVLRVLSETQKPLSELTSPYQPMPQVLLNVPVSRKPDLTELPGVVDLVREIEEELGEDGRVLLRYSGTEDLARVMVEGLDASEIQALADSLATCIRAEIGA
ncbi:MAG: phosphoglucosamine mutase [bacterium]|nr:phosphoglucosamine mutase [bacterium]